MINVIWAEMRKLRRPTLLLSTMAIVTLLTVLFTFLTFWRVGNPRGNGRRGATTPGRASPIRRN